MGAISDFLAAFTRDYEKYRAIERELEALCSKALRPDIEFLWQSRVKAAESLEKKLRGRVKDYKNESENVADVKDLVAGRIILARWLDFQRVEEIVKRNFTYKSQTQHPKQVNNAVNFKARFRGYDGLHFYVMRQGPTDEKACNPVIEIQVMSAFMWAFSTLQHDIEYKKLHGEPDEDQLWCLDSLKGAANLGEIFLQMYEKRFFPVAKLSTQQSVIKPDLQSSIHSIMADVAFKFDEKDSQCLRDLRLTDPRHDKERIEASKDRLLDGSCSWVLEDPAFVNWWTRDNSRLLWIHGDPGKGKTMMMIALISEVSKRLNDRPGSNVLAYFFCQNTSHDLNTTVSVLRGLIYLLVDQEKKLVRHIRRHYDGAGRQLFEGPNATYALRGILSDILKDESLGNVFFMIDALDECDAKIHELLDWIIHEEPGISPKIKWLTTSRNEPAFTEQLGRDRQLHTSLELNSLHVGSAVTSFIDYKVRNLADLKSYDSELQAFVQKSLNKKAEDTFLWVALVCKELSKVWRQRPQKVRSLLEKIPAGLIPLYERMLDQVLHQEDKNDIELSRRILCSVTLAKRPLRFEEIAVFANISDDEGDVEELVGLCGSFLTVREQTVYLVHQSTKDYLSDGKRKDIFLLGQEYEHANTASLCLKKMSTILRKDICNLQAPGFSLSDVEQSSIRAHIPFYAQYACLYWADHLQQAGSTKQETLTLREDCQVLQFFKTHFLHWLEALSLMGKLSEAVLGIKSLCSIHRSRMSNGLTSFVNDARRFILQFRFVIETAPLQVYISALVFSPKASIIKCLFSYELPPWIERLPSVEEAWPASLQTLGNAAEVDQVIFSPDGQLLACASWDNKIRIWDTTTGVLRGTLKGYSSWPIAMLFLSDGQLLTSPSYRHIFKIWDPITGVSRDILEGRLYDAALTFSPDGRFLASASKDKAIRLWDPLRGTVRGVLGGHLDFVSVMAFSPPHGQLLASGSRDRTVRLWDSSTGASRGTLEGHLGSIEAVSFSPPDGRLLASVSKDDCVIRLWDTSMGVLKCTLKGHSGSICSILFSPNGQLLVSTSDDRTTRFWDSATGVAERIITGASEGLTEGWPENAEILVFSPDGRLLALGRFDNTIQLQDSVTGALHGTLKGHLELVRTMTFSPDSHFLASGSNDGTVRLWDLDADASEDELEGHSGPIEVMVFSPCGHVLASGSDDRTVRLWDAATGTSRYILESHSSDISAIAFSPNSQLLASGFEDGIIKIWDLATGACRGTLQGEVCAVALTHDGQTLASGTQYGTIMLLDLALGDSRGIIERSHGNWITSLAFSTDGQTLASASPDNIVRLWDVTTLAPRSMLTRGLSLVIAMSFSPDCQLLASACDEGTVEVWDIQRKTAIHRNELYRGGNISFNHDGSQLEVSGWLVQISSSLHDSAHERVLTTAPYGMDAEKEWVTYNGRNVLWLPHNRRPYKYAVQNNTLVLGSGSGRVSFFEFSSTVAPPCT